jgi:hypothetical protein
MGLFSGIAKAIAGPLVGGLFGSLDKPKADYTGAQNQVSWRVADAKRAKIHPLAALGMSPGMGPVISQSNIAPWAADAAQNLANMASDKDLAALSGEKLKSEIALNHALRAESIGRTGLGYAQSQKIHSDMMRDNAARNSVQDQAVPEFIQVRKKDGSIELRRNPDLVDPEVDIWHWLKGKGESLDDWFENKAAPWLSDRLSSKE